MAITPNTNIRLLKSPIKIDNKNQIDFTTKTEQTKHFLSLPYDDEGFCSYQRKDNVIRWNQHIDSIISYNYVMYQNNNYSSKWFYAFITNMVYVNDNRTDIYITTDVWQTWQFDITFQDSFIEREHLSSANDTAGANLLPEGLELGEVKVNSTAEIKGLKPVYVIAYGRNPKEDGLTSQTPIAMGVIANGIPCGMYFCVCNEYTIQGVLSSINGKGFGDSIISVFSVPALAWVGFNGWTLETLTGNSGILWWLVSDFKANPITVNLVSRPSSIDGYTPHNKKLLTYPYLYIGFNPVNGSEKIYRYENFSNGTPVFKIHSEINPNPTICVIPQNYRGANGDSLSDIGEISGYPTIGWISEYFSSWLAQNSQIIEIQQNQEQYNYEVDVNVKQVQQYTNAGAGLLNSMGGNFGGAVSTGSEFALDSERIQQMHQNHGYYIQNQLAQVEKHSLLPNTSHLGTSATLLGYDKIEDNVFTRYSIKKQFAERIDKFFDMYGYLTSTVKKPNIKNRTNWNYVKTIGLNILGDIPQGDLQSIKTLFDNGITFWHNTNTFGDYSQSNN